MSAIFVDNQTFLAVYLRYSYRETKSIDIPILGLRAMALLKYAKGGKPLPMTYLKKGGRET